MAKKPEKVNAAVATPGQASPVPTTPDTTSPESAKPERAKPEQAKRTPWFRFSIMILFGVVYAWDLFVALSNLIGKLDQIAQINEVRELNGFPLMGIPWVPLIANLALPLVVFLLALWIARRRNVGILAIVLFAGLGVVAAVSLSLIAYVLATS